MTHGPCHQKQVLWKLRKKRTFKSDFLLVHLPIEPLTDVNDLVLTLLVFPPSTETTNNLAHLHKHTWPDEDKNINLIGQSMQRSSQSIHASGKGQVGVRQGAAHQVTGVGTYVASFMVTAHMSHIQLKMGHHSWFFFCVCAHEICNSEEKWRSRYFWGCTYTKMLLVQW